ncbi:uncharacterized protein LOC121429049, partial [Lytechinus variegatus]|uniref:uncharacterized protein LOC121429049 n=1 Tax=Lytechinus variegatus TaxID=7654 RepID=UPI001BB21E93
NVKDLRALSELSDDVPTTCAQYCTYTFMEHETNDVLHVGFVDKREVGMKSNVMEAKAFKEGLSIMEERGLQVKEVVTDAHPSIGKYMSIFFSMLLPSFTLLYIIFLSFLSFFFVSYKLYASLLFFLHKGESKPEVKHSWDVWHGAKNLAKKLAKVN